MAAALQLVWRVILVRVSVALVGGLLSRVGITSYSVLALTLILLMILLALWVGVIFGSFVVLNLNLVVLMVVGIRTLPLLMMVIAFILVLRIDYLNDIIRPLLIQEMYQQEGSSVAAITAGIARLLLQMRRIQ